MIYTIGFIILIGVLVLAHELGHFLMGKLFKVRVDTFSIGFGKPLLKKKIGYTEYRLSMFPVGGYVKFYDDSEKDGKVPEDKKHLTLAGQKVWKRALIVFGGPAFNFILAIFLFAAVLVIGEPSIDTVLNQVEPGSIAWNSGLRPGDRILEIEGRRVKTWQKMEGEISKYDNSISIKLERNDSILSYSVPVHSAISRNMFGEMVHTPQIIGIAPYKRSSLVGVSFGSLADRSGFRTGDFITNVGDMEVNGWDDLEKAFMHYFKKTKSPDLNDITVLFLRDGEKDELFISVEELQRTVIKHSRTYALGSVRIRDENYSFLNNMGFFPSEVFISDFVTQDSPALTAGMDKNDRIVAINGEILHSFKALQLAVDNAGRTGEALDILVERRGLIRSFSISPSIQELKDPSELHKEERFLLGVQTHFMPGPSTQKYISVRNPIMLIIESVERTITWIWMTLVGLFKLITGSLPVRALGGPIMIGKVAGESLHMGAVYFLRIMAIISINLGIINLFPIPVLDGGHLVFFTFEAIRGKPLKEKHMMMAQQIGFYLLMGLIFMAFYNDILRFSGAFLEIFR